MSISKPQGGSSLDIELPVLTSHARSSQPLHGQAPPSSPIPEKNSTEEVEPPVPAYFPPSNDIPPIPSFDVGLLAYTQAHGHSDLPLSPRQGEVDRASVQPSEAHAEALPAYGVDSPPLYSRTSRQALEEPTTLPTICFRLGFLFPPFWLLGALTLVTPRGSLARRFRPWFKNYGLSTESWCHDNMQTEAEKEAYLARMRALEIASAKKCLFAFSLNICLITAIVVILVTISQIKQ